MDKNKIKQLEKRILSGPFKQAQELVNSGRAWILEGSVGRSCMEAINSGAVLLGEEGHRDYWGNYVPSRHEVKAGTKGSPEFVEKNYDSCVENYG